MTTLRIRQTDKYGVDPKHRRLPTTDTVISPPSKAELKENSERTARMSGLDLGRRWVGDLTEKLDAIQDPKEFADALSAIVGGIAEYGNNLGKSNAEEGPAGALAFRRENLGDEEEQEERQFEGNGATSEREPANDMRRWRNQDQARIESVQEANRKFYERK